MADPPDIAGHRIGRIRTATGRAALLRKTDRNGHRSKQHAEASRVDYRHRQEAVPGERTDMRYDLVDLKLFRAIAETSSLSAGASQIFLSPGSASYRLKNLERLVGTPLFTRTPKGMLLTRAGESLLRHVITVFSDLERMHSELSSFAGGMRGNIRLHANSSSLNGFLPGDLSRFLVENRQCNIDLEEHNSDDIVMSVSDGTADLGVVASEIESGSLQVFPYANDRLVLAMSLTHPLSSRQAVYLEEALEHDFVCMHRSSSNFQFLSQTAARIGKSLNTRIHAHNFATVLQLSRENVGIALVPNRVVENTLPAGSCAIVALSDDWAERKLKIVVHDISKTSHFTRALVDHLLLSNRQ
ncbi:LysR family transcriptional regulator [Tardiphaga sp. 862_B3_N1_1]|uniref:LysR family transcriptional regulator n=1 Tax=Tardiphaga sp. 862_B3_N1_1 TaxID=3240763 RepID=UPI003F8C1AC8